MNAKDFFVNEIFGIKNRNITCGHEGCVFWTEEGMQVLPYVLKENVKPSEELMEIIHEHDRVMNHAFRKLVFVDSIKRLEKKEDVSLVSK